MQSCHMTDLFIFRRDLRISDNLAWTEMARTGGGRVLPIFIFNEKQFLESKNRYYSKNAFQFMLESLMDLDRQLVGALRCFVTEADDTKVLQELVTRLGDIRAVWFNADFTPFARQRDQKIAAWCKGRGIECRIVEGDYTLLPPGSVVNGTGQAFRVYSPFMRAFHNQAEDIPTVNKAPSVSYVKTPGHTTVEAMWKRILREPNPHLYVQGGRRRGLSLLKRMKDYKKYDNERNQIWNEKGTTKMGAYLKFGCISVREMYRDIASSLGRTHALISQLIWREFYANIAYAFPNVLHGENMRPPVKKMTWKKNPEAFEKWSQGKTGVPLVDAGMRQLVITGYMHNRVRMITASYLVKNLSIDWRLGERFFAQHLVDYDPSSNNGNWQWIAGTGADYQPFDRTFNPYAQAKRYDPNCVYIRRWIPELKNVPCNDILRQPV